MPEKSRTVRKMKDTLEHFESVKQLPTDHFNHASKFDDADILVNLANGVLRLRPDGTVALESHSKDHYFCARLAARYDVNATATLFEKTLVQALPDRDDQLLFLLWAASILLPSARFEAALCAYGPSGTSKSTLAGGIQSVLGLDVTTVLTLKEICNDQGYSLPKLRRSMLNVSTELDTVTLESSENFKRLISGEQVEAREIYGSPFVMSTVCKFLFLTNHLPRFKFGTDAELRRLRFLRFNEVPTCIDATVKDRIPLERDGIFRLLVDELPVLLRLNVMPNGGPNSETARRRFAVTNDPVGSFVADQCVIDPTDYTSKDTLCERFNFYLDDIGLPSTIGDHFCKLLYDRYPSVRPRRVRTNSYQGRVIDGIGLKNPI